MMSTEDFVSDALTQLANGQDEVLVSMATGTLKMGEASFERMNGS